ncbi:MAG: diacylglycerol kinase family protein [Solirubrobacterales bacterium]
MKIALIANRDSGSGDAERVASLLEDAGAEVVSFAIDEAERAGESGAERIAVAGGDGSVGCAAEVASRADIPLAVIATGTANDFASHHGLPGSLEAACAIASGGTRTEHVELAEVCGRPFVNVAAAGLPPAAAEEAHSLKERLGALAYPIGAVRVGLRAHPVECAVEVDGEVIHDGLVWQVSVASSGAFGGGASLEGDTRDGLLDVVVIEHGGRARLIKHAYGLRIGRVEGHRGVVSTRGSAIAMRLDPTEKLNVDGELVRARDLDGDGRLSFAAERNGFELITG